MARTHSQAKRLKKKSSETRSYISRGQKSTCGTPFTMQTRRCAKNSTEVVEVNSTRLRVSGAGTRNVEADDNLDEQNPSSPPSGFIHESSEGVSPILDPFQWNADEQSESDSVSLLQDINTSINDALAPILSLLSTRMRYYTKPNLFGTEKHNITKNLDPRLEGPLVQELYAARMGQSKIIFGVEVIEAFLQDAISVTLYRRFFAGTIFFGILHTDAQKWALDTMFHYLLKQEKWSVVQRWRSLASSAPTLEPQAIQDTLDKIAVEIATNARKAFNIVYPTSSINFNKLITELINKLEKSIQGIVVKAHKISMALQQDVVTNRLKVVLSLPQGGNTTGVSYVPFGSGLTTAAHTDHGHSINGEQILGTVSFGLIAIRPGIDGGPITKVLLPPTTTTASLFSVSNK